MDSLNEMVSASLMGWKTELKTLAAQIDEWILTMQGEDERRIRIRALNTIIGLHGDRLPAADRRDAHDHLEALLHLSEFMMFSSVGYREKLQNQVKSQLEKMGGQVDEVIGRVNLLMQRIDGPRESANSSGGIIHAQEEDRKRISRDIHDGPAQALAALTMRIDFASALLERPTEMKAELAGLKDALIGSLQDIRRFIFDLRPMAIDDLGLIPTLEQFIKGRDGSAARPPVHLTIEGDRRSLPPDLELGVFRIIQEAVNNAIRHARATAIDIALHFHPEPGGLAVSVRDNGVGFDVENLRRIYASLKKLGLVSMEERARAIGGTFELVSMPGGGTRVAVTVPG